MDHQDIVELERGTTEVLVKILGRLEVCKIWTKQIGKLLQSFPIYLLAGLLISENYNLTIWIVAITITGIENLMKTRILGRKNK